MFPKMPRITTTFFASAAEAASRMEVDSASAAICFFMEASQIGAEHPVPERGRDAVVVVGEFVVAVVPNGVAMQPRMLVKIEVVEHVVQEKKPAVPERESGEEPLGADRMAHEEHRREERRQPPERKHHVLFRMLVMPLVRPMPKENVQQRSVRPVLGEGAEHEPKQHPEVETERAVV